MGEATREERKEELHTVIPLVEERASVTKRKRTKGSVRVIKRVVETEELVRTPLVTEQVLVERVPKNRTVRVAPKVRVLGDLTIIPVVEEVLVVQKQLVLKEEIHIRRRQSKVEHQGSVTLRKEVVQIERQKELP